MLEGFLVRIVFRGLEVVCEVSEGLSRGSYGFEVFDTVNVDP